MTDISTLPGLAAAIEAAARMRQYVTDKRTGEVIGMIAWHEGCFVLASKFRDGDMRDSDNYIVCRRYKANRKHAALSEAAKILNGGHDVGIASTL